MKELEEARRELDAVDRQLVSLFEQRMLLSRDVVAYKLAHGLPVLDQSREAAVISSRKAMLQDPHFAPGVETLYETIMALSRKEQERILKEVKSHA